MHSRLSTLTRVFNDQSKNRPKTFLRLGKTQTSQKAAKVLKGPIFTHVKMCFTRIRQNLQVIFLISRNFHIETHASLCY